MSVTDVAIEKIKEMIVSGELGPGDRLPREADLAQRLGLSRSSLREAVRALSLVRILDVRQGDGTYVTSLDPSLLLEARRLLEAEAVALAAQRIDDAQLAELRELLEAMPGCETVEQFVQNDIAFHHAIAVASGNPVIAKLLDSLSGPTVRARIWRGITEGAAIDRTIAEHRAIYDALEQRRPDLAEAWMTVHLASVEAWLQSAAAVPAA